MALNRRDIVQILRDENHLLKARNQQVSKKLARQQQAFRVLNELCEATLSIDQNVDIPEILNHLLRLVMHTCNTENGSLILIDENAQELEFVAVIGESQNHLLNHRIDIKTGAVGYVIEQGKSMLIDDVHNSRHWSSVIDERLDFHTHSLMCAPLLIHDVIIGAIEVVNHTADTAFDENDLNILNVATRLVGLAFEKVEKLTMQMEAK
jgi:transcriptional regulator with GAF, ATPase, and Fis domain